MNTKVFRGILLTVLTTACCIVLGFLLMLAVSLLPIEPIDRNAANSVGTLERDGDYPQRKTVNGEQVLENYTDALMMMTAACPREQELVAYALAGGRKMVKGEEEVRSYALYYYPPEDQELQVVTATYPRYWHGYLVALKPLLCLFNLRQIRKLFLMAQALLAGAIVCMMFVRRLGRYVLPLLLSLTLLSPLVIAQSLHYSCVYFVLLLACLFLLVFHRRMRRKEMYFVFFTAVGCATSFVDLLTTPLLTLCFPLILYICLNAPRRLKAAARDVFFMCVCWAVGYVGMWAGKWVLATLLTDMNVIRDALSTVMFRTSQVDGRGEAISYMEILRRNWSRLEKSPIWGASLLVMLAGILAAGRQRRLKQLLPRVCGFGLVMLLPFLWMRLAGNHSYIHPHFVSRILAILPFAGMCMCILPASERPAGQATSDPDEGRSARAEVQSA